MRPKILMLMGGGTNVGIFEMQTRKLATLLSPDFDLVYIEAPLDSGPGLGVLPIFEGAGPFKTWIRDEPLGAEKMDWEQLDDLYARFHAKGPFAGIVSFSQGAKAALHLIRRLEKEGNEGALRFIVAICATCPYQGITDPEDPRAPLFQESLARGRAELESIHVIADSDPLRKQSEALVQFFDEHNRKVVRFKGGHHMPQEDSVNKLLAQYIMYAYQGM